VIKGGVHCIRAIFKMVFAFLGQAEANWIVDLRFGLLWALTERESSRLYHGMGTIATYCQLSTLRRSRTNDLHVLTLNLLPPFRMAQRGSEQYCMDVAIPSRFMFASHFSLVRLVDNLDYVSVWWRFANTSTLVGEHSIITAVKMWFHLSGSIRM
jgi:hypothetical protein